MKEFCRGCTLLDKRRVNDMRAKVVVENIERQSGEQTERVMDNWTDL